jgi:hypothetical protein
LKKEYFYRGADDIAACARDQECNHLSLLAQDRSHVI